MQSLEAFSSPVGVLDPEAVNRDQREKLTVRQLGGVAGISAQGGMMSRMALELLRPGSAGLVDIWLWLSFADIAELNEK